MLFAWTLLAGPTASAQATGQGTISGTVTDSSGAVIGGAHLTITDVEANVAHETETNRTGYYEVDDLKPGASSLTITVTADASLLNVESGSNGQVLTTRQVENRPVAGNDTTYLSFLAPSVQANASVSMNQTDTVGSNAVTKDFDVFGQIGINEFNHIDLGAPNTSVTSDQFGWVTTDGSPGSVARWVAIQGRFSF